MKYILTILTALTFTTLLTGCESEAEAKHRRQLEIIRAQSHADARVVKAQNDQVRVINGTNQGVVHTNQHVVHPTSGGIDGGDVLLGVGAGMVAASLVNSWSDNDWDHDDDGRYYNSKSGKYISNDEYYRRKAQSERDKRLAAERKLKSKANVQGTNKSVSANQQTSYKPRHTVKPKLTPKPRSTVKPVPTKRPKATPTANNFKSGKITSFGGKSGGQKGYNSNTYSGTKTPAHRKHKTPKKARKTPKRTKKSSKEKR